MIVAVLAFKNSFSYPVESTIYVRFVLGIFFILSAVMFLMKPKKEKPLSGLVTSNRVKAFALVAVYIILIPILGFFVSTFLFAVVFMSIFNSKGIVKYLVTSGIFTLAMYLLFDVVLKIWFPAGLLF
jgi:hypothetical protein